MLTYRTRVMLIIFALVVGTTLWQWYDPTFHVRLSVTPREDQVEIWRERIRAVGPEAAYVDFAKAEEGVAAEEQHRYAHIFGNALFAETDTNGIGICDMRFQFGCLHEYFGHVIAKHGVGILPVIAEECKKQIQNAHPCQHALGHGILANLGYDTESLKRALDLCSSAYSDDPINGCLGGVFMEFNLYESLSLESKPRDAEKDGWYSPCPSLLSEYQRSCAWWLPQWWYEYMRLVAESPSTSEERFKQLGQRCRSIPIVEFRRDCFEHIGQLTLWGSESDPAQAIRLCRVAAETVPENLVCKAYAAYMFRYYYDDVEQATAFCRGLPTSEKIFCETYARGDAYTPHDVPLPKDLRD